jgi:hypothetical protein
MTDPNFAPDPTQLQPGAPPEEQVGVPTPRSRRRHLALIVTLVVVLVVGGLTAAFTTIILHAVNQPNASASYHSAKFGYSVALPGKPTVTNSNGSTGATQRAHWTSGVTDIEIDAEAFPGVLPANKVSTVLDATLKGGPSAVGGSNIREQKSFTVGGEPAKSELFDVVGGHTVYIEAVVHNNAVYAIILAPETPALQQAVRSTFHFTK